MKKALTVLMAGLISASTLLGGCANNTGNKPNSTPSTSEKESVGVVVADGYTRYDITTPHARKTEGFGTQFDTCIVEKQNAISDEEWEIQVNALKEMNLQNVRIRFFPEWYERGNDNDDPNVFDYYSKDVDFNSAEMKYLYRILDAFEENMTEAESRLADTDMAQEMTTYTQQNVLNQAAISVLTQANDMPQQVLQLLQ